MKKAKLVAAMLTFLVAGVAAAWAAGPAPGMSADEALKMLKEGNARYLEGKPKYPNQTPERRALTTGQGQHPFAAVLSCADSRVPVELILDRGIGDLLVARVAGNVAGVDEIATLEYAVDQMEIPLLVVLGHSQCQAVAVMVQNVKLPGNVAALLKPIHAAAARAKADNPGVTGEALIQAAIQANIYQAVEDLFQKSPIIKGRVKGGKMKVAGALYEVDTGQVQWLGPHPAQDKLLGIKTKGPAPGPKKKKGQD